MAVRTFDVVGGLAVAGWLVITGLFVYRTEWQSNETGQALESDGLNMEAGDTWMLLRRQGDEIGYLHRTHTRLEDGWLVEYDMLAILEIVGRELPLETTVKATIDTEGYVSNVQADAKIANRSFEARGQVDDRSATLIVESGDDQSMQRTIDFEERPRLASNSVHQLLAQDNLDPGDTFEETYFDPTSMSRESIVMTYKGREEISVFDRKENAHFIRQTVAGRELDIYVDDQGRILVQEFPMKVVGARVRPDLAKTRASNLRQRARDLRNKLASKGSKIGRGLEMALGVLGLGSGGGSQMIPDIGASQMDDSSSDSKTDASTGSPPPDAGAPASDVDPNAASSDTADEAIAR